MKKVFLIVLSVILILIVGYYFFTFILINRDNIDDEKFNIVTSFYPMYIATANIIDGAENVTLENLTSTEVGCLHDYQLTTSDMMKLEKADTFVINGGGMESFIDKAIKNYEGLKLVNASKDILSDEYNEEIQNSHIWVSVEKYIKQVKNIRDGLCEINPENSEIYRSNSESYINKLLELKNNMEVKIGTLANKNIVTFHEAFYYFAEEFDLNLVAVIEREPGTKPSAGEIVDIIEKIKDTDAKAIFVEPQYERTAADTISKETNVPVYTLDPIVTGELYKEAYIDIMNKNLGTLMEALENGE